MSDETCIMDVDENSVVLKYGALGVLKEIADALKEKFNPNFGVAQQSDGYAIVVTAPTTALAFLMFQVWADGYLAKYRKS